MKILLLLFAFALVTSTGHAAIDLESYPLTEKQKKTGRLLIEHGASDELVLKYINACLNSKPAPSIYIPPHTQDELSAVQRWAGIGAFASFADSAGYEFDRKRYLDDCPNWAIFNFGRQTGMTYLKVDVTQSFIGITYGLQQSLSKNPGAFPEIFWKFAINTGADKYLNKKLYRVE